MSLYCLRTATTAVVAEAAAAGASCIIEALMCRKDKRKEGKIAANDEAGKGIGTRDEEG